MTIILFLVDTSASMNQKTYLGLSYLDLVKGAIDTLLKLRLRDPNRSQERYLLLTLEESPRYLKIGWKEGQAQFSQELKNLEATGLTTLSQGLANAFHLLNGYRLQNGIDTFGHGRCPFYLDPVMIVAFTDGNSLTSSVGIQKDVELRLPPLAGTELCAEPFRWDQRLFAVVLRLPGHAAADPNRGQALSHIPSDSSPISLMCEVTGGRSYSIQNHRMLNQCVESLSQKMQHGVVLYFEKVGVDPVQSIPLELNESKALFETQNGYVQDARANHKLINHLSTLNNVLNRPTTPSSRAESPNLLNASNQDWHTVRRLIFVPRPSFKGQFGHWPIPESYWSDQTLSALPSRSAQPVICFKCEDCEPLILDGLPFDKYELEPSPLTQFILNRRQPTTCWQVFVRNSGNKANDSLGAPFGYLKASTNLATVNLFVMPYNYPKIIPLLKELVTFGKGKPNKDWKSRFESYLKSIPAYYYPPLKKALQRMGHANVMNENVDSAMSYSVLCLSYLKRIKYEAKTEFDRICLLPSQNSSPPELVRLIPRSSISLLSILKHSPLNTATSCQITPNVLANLKQDTNEYQNFTISNRVAGGLFADVSGNSAAPANVSAMFRNPFDISRSSLIEQLVKMRSNLIQHFSNQLSAFEGRGLPGMKLRIHDAEKLHNLPIGHMGLYQEYLRRMTPPLRELEAAPVRQHAFGNPFKVDKKMFVDEADIDNLVQSDINARANLKSMSGGGSSNKRQHNDPAYNKFRASRKRPGPLPKDFRYYRKRRHLLNGDIDDRSSDDTDSILSVEEEDHSLPIVDVIELSEDDDEKLPSSPLIVDLLEPSNSSGVNRTAPLFNHIGYSSNGSRVGDDESFNEETESNELDYRQKIQLKKEIRSKIRKPGKDFTHLIDLLNSLPNSNKETLIKFAINEALRFKRRNLEEEIRSILNK